MRLRCAFVLAAFLSVLPLALGGDRAASLVQSIRPSSLSERQLVLEAKFLCGMFDGSFACKNVPGAVMHGKNAAPGAPEETDQPEGMTGAPSKARQRPLIPVKARRAERLMRLRPASMEWSARRPIASARRIRNYWAAIACITLRRPAATGWPPTASPKPAVAPRRRSPAACVRTA